jgi:hypothetical protein
MLTAYSNQTDVPEALREHYSKREDGKWHADIPNDHPAIKHNAKLLNEKKEADDKATQLQSDLDSAKSSGLPRGHVAVAKADAELLNEVKALGPIAEVKTKLTEHESLKAEVAKAQRVENQRKVAAALGYNEAAFLQLANLPDMEIREKDGKKSVVALVKDGDKVVEKVATEYVEATYAPLLPALKAKGETTVSTSGASAGATGAADPFAAAREFGKQWNQTAATAGDVASRFGIAKTA